MKYPISLEKEQYHSLSKFQSTNKELIYHRYSVQNPKQQQNHNHDYQDLVMTLLTMFFIKNLKNSEKKVAIYISMCYIK